MTALTASACRAASTPDTVAFHYQAIFSPEATRWFRRFRLLVTGAVLSPTQSQALRDGGPRLIAYEWSTGLYPGEPSSHRDWLSTVLSNRSWLLSPNPSGGASAAPGRSAFWYDFGNPELRLRRARWLAQLLDHSRYDGLFFDTVGFEQLPDDMRAEFSRRWPGQDYNACQGAFLAELRRLIGTSRIIFLNQGFRHAAHLLPHADLDLTESYFTSIDGARTRFRSWHDDRAPWESIRTPMQQLVMPAALQFPNLRFVHVNYATPDSAPAAARYSWAVAKLWNHDAYLMAPDNASREQDPIYFTPTGAPLESSWLLDGDIVYRRFELGIAAINTSPHQRTLSLTATLVPPGPDGFFFPA